MAPSAKFFFIISMIISKETVTASEVETFDEKTFDLIHMLKNDYVLHISDVDFFNKYVRSPKKEYSFVVLFTLLENCPMCEFPYQEFLIIAHSHKQSKESNKLFFGIVDYNQSPGMFKMMQLNSVPVVAVFPANENRKPYLFKDMEINAYQAENMAFLIEKKIHVKINIQRSILMTNILSWVLFLMPIIYFLYQRGHNDFVEFVSSRHIWAMTAVVYCGLLTSGQIYNHILQPPIIDLSEEGDGNITYQIESYAAALIVISTSIGMIILIEGRGGVEKNKLRINDSACVVGLILVVFCFSIYLYMLKRKLSGQYPYSMIF